MGLIYQSHKGNSERKNSLEALEAAPPVPNDIAVDEKADFGFFMPPSGDPADYLAEEQQTVTDLDSLGNLMIDQSNGNPGSMDASPDSALPPVMTYWGQFLDHELTARTDRDGSLTSIVSPLPTFGATILESSLKNARTPRFDLDSVYGGIPLGFELEEGLATDVSRVIAGMRHPAHPHKMRVGTAHPVGPLPDTLDSHRDLPRFRQVEPEVRDAALRIAQRSMSAEEFEKFRSTINKRALIGDMRNDENLIVAQFHLSFLRFHNRSVDFLENNNTGWIADFASAQLLTRLHYQWLSVHSYLKSVCDPDVVERLIDNRANRFTQFRAEYLQRHTGSAVGNVLPFEFSAAIFRFGHTMVRNIYDYNRNFGRPGTGFLPNAPFDLMFTFTGGGGFRGDPKLPENWIIDWTRFVGVAPNEGTDGQPARFARKLDTELAPPLGQMLNDGNDQPNPSELRDLFKHLARRNLRRGLNLRLPTGQALHRYLFARGAVNTPVIEDVSAIFTNKPAMQQFLQGSASSLNTRTPLWFYCLAEAERAGGHQLGELGSFIVASTFVGVMLSDPDSALSRGFHPSQSPLRSADGSDIDDLAKWMQFALVME